MVGRVRREQTRLTEADLERMLDGRFAEGVRCLSRNMPRRLYRLAVRKGFLSKEGYLTAKGRSLLAQLRAG